MTHRLINLVVSLLLMAFLAGGVIGATIPEPVSANCGGGFFLAAWYDGLTDGNCNMISPSDGGITLQSYILTIALNIVTIALQIVGYAAIFYIIYGGFKFMTSAGSPDLRSSAIKTILNAIIGLIIAISSVAILNLLQSILVGSTNNVGIYTQLSGSAVMTSVLNIVYWIAGALAVIMGVISGLNFVTSAGDPQKAAKARSGLMYAAVGLLVVALAAVITSFIQGRF